MKINLTIKQWMSVIDKELKGVWMKEAGIELIMSADENMRG